MTETIDISRISQKLSKGFLPFLIVILALIILMYKSCMVYIKPNEFGIKQVNIALLRKKGIQNKEYTTGLNFVLPFGIEKIHIFPKNLQVLELSDYATPNSKKNSRRSFSNLILPSTFTTIEPSANIQTSDGFFVTVDVTILYKITNPYLLITTVGAGKLYEDNGIIPKAEPILKEALGSLTTEEFYNSPLRVSKTEQAKTIFNKALNPKGIQVEQVLVRYFKYSPEIQKNIEEKKLKDQLVFKNRAEGRAEKEKANLAKVIEEGEAIVSVKLEEGKAYKITKEAEKDLYVRKKKAEADLLVKLAEAKRTELKNEALKGTGSTKMVGLKMAEALEGIELIMLSSNGNDGLNPLDLNKTIELFGIKGQEE